MPSFIRLAPEMAYCCIIRALFHVIASMFLVKIATYYLLQTAQPVFNRRSDIFLVRTSSVALGLDQEPVGSSPTTPTMASGLIAFEKCCKATRFLYA